MTLKPIPFSDSVDELHWPINYSAERLCYVDKDCETMLKGQSGDNKIYKCGDPTTYNIPIETDNL